MKLNPLLPTSVIPIAFGLGLYDVLATTLIVWFADTVGSVVKIGERPLSENVCWTSFRTWLVKSDCCWAFGTPPKTCSTVGLRYQASAPPLVSVLASGYGPVPKLMKASAAADELLDDDPAGADELGAETANDEFPAFVTVLLDETAAVALGMTSVEEEPGSENPDAFDTVPGSVRDS